MTVGVGLSVHTMSCYPLATFGTDEQRGQWLPEMLEGSLLGAYALSEAQAGSDAAALSTRATADGDDYLVTGTKAWITHAGQADFYTLLVRPSGGPGAGGRLPAGRRVDPRPDCGRARAQDGPDRLADRADPARSGAGAGPPPDRGRGRRAQVRPRRAQLRAARHRRLRRRPGPGAAGR